MTKIRSGDRLAALSTQLQAEIKASPYHSIRALADSMGEDYTTLYKQITLRPGSVLRMERVFDVLDRIDVDPVQFMRNVEERAARGAG